MEQESEKLDGVDSSKTSGSSLGGLAHKSRVPRALVFNKASQKDHQPEKSDHDTNEQIPGSLEGRDAWSDADKWRDLTGCRVCISGVKHGILRYFGRTQFAEGLWCGVELFEAVGKNDGSVKGVRYFHCQPNHGIFAPFTKVQLTDMSPIAGGAAMLEGDTTTRLPPPKMVPKDFFLRASHAHENVAANGEALVKDTSSERDHTPASRDGVKVSPTAEGGLSHIPKTNKVPSHSAPSNGFPEEILPLKHSTGPSLSENHSNGVEPNLVDERGRNSSESSCKDELPEDGEEIQLDNSDSCVHQQTPNSLDFSAHSVSHTDSSLVSTPTNPPEDLDPDDVENVNLNKAFSFEELKRRKESVSLSEVLSSGILDKCEDFEDDQMSLDLDESLCILTPSQMKDFTVCAELEAITLPSSESFDDINEIPEDEQVQDIVTEFISSDESPVVQAVSMTRTAPTDFGDGTRPQGWNTGENGVKGTTVDEIFYSIHCKDAESYTRQSSAATTPTVCNSDKDDLPFPSKLAEPDSHAVCPSGEEGKAHSESRNDTEEAAVLVHKGHPLSPIMERKGEITMSPPVAVRAHKDEEMVLHPAMGYTENNQSIPLKVSPGDKVSGYSPLQVEIEPVVVAVVQFSPQATVVENSVGKDTSSAVDLVNMVMDNERHKNQLSVTWDKDSEVVGISSKDERPDSVYTVGSTDTGYQEDEDFDQHSDAGASVLSPTGDDLKRLSSVSRDSCVVAEEVEGEKIVESVSTSGYSTGLSDSCANEKDGGEESGKTMIAEQKSLPERNEQEISVKFSKDEEVEEDVTLKDDTCRPDNKLQVECQSAGEPVLQNGEVPESPSGPVEEDEKDDKEGYCNGVDSAVEEEDEAVDVTEPSEQQTIKESPSGFFSKNKLSQKPGKSKNKPDSQKRSKKDDAEEKKNGESEKGQGKPPKKNVMSKIKAMIEATSCKTLGSKAKGEGAEPIRKVVQKKSRWEAVTSRIAASLAEEKAKPKKKEVKSKIDTNLSGTRQIVARKSPKTESAMSVCSLDSDSVILNLSHNTKNWKNASDHQSDISGKNSVITDSLDSYQNGECTDHGRRSPKPTNYTLAKQPPPRRQPPASSRSASPIAPSEGSSVSLISRGSHVLPQNTARHHHKGSTNASASVPNKTAPCPPTKRNVSSTATVATKSPSQARTKKGPGVGREQHPSKPVHHPAGPGKSSRPPASSWISRTELNQEIQRLGSLCEARTKELTLLKMKLKRAAVGFDAFAVVVRYLTEELDAFSHPQLIAKVQKLQDDLLRAENQLSNYQEELENQKQQHAYDLATLSEQLSEVHQQDILKLMTRHSEEMEKVQDQQKQQINEIMQSHLTESQDAEKNYAQFVENLKENQLKQKEELIQLHKKEIEDLEEKHRIAQSTLNNQLEELRQQFGTVNLRAKQAEETLQRDTDSKIQWLSLKKVDLEKEVDSLKAVLEMKRHEIHALRKENLEMQKELEELPIAREKIKMLKARAEDLQALVEEKVRIERQLSSEHCQLKESFEKGYKENKRLTMENEELAWKLKQNTETSLLLSSLTGSPEALEKLVSDLSPVKSPAKYAACRPTFFTFADGQNNEDQPNTLPSGTPYRRISPAPPSLSKPTCTERLTHLAKSPSSPGPRKCKSPAGTEVQTSPRETPRKFKHSPQKSRTSPRRKSRLTDSASSVPATTNSKKSSLKEQSDKAPSEDMISSTSSDGSAINEALPSSAEIHHSDDTVLSLLRLPNQQNNDTTLSLQSVDGMETNWQFVKEMKMQIAYENDGSVALPLGEHDFANIPVMLGSIPDAKQYYHMAFTEANKIPYAGFISDPQGSMLHNGELGAVIMTNTAVKNIKETLHEQPSVLQTKCSSKDPTTEECITSSDVCSEQKCPETVLKTLFPTTKNIISSLQRSDNGQERLCEGDNFCIPEQMVNSFVSASDSSSFVSHSSKPSYGSQDMMSQSFVDDASLNSVSSGEQFENIISQENEMCSLGNFVQNKAIFGERQKYTGLLQNLAGEAMTQESSVSVSLSSSNGLPVTDPLVNKTEAGKTSGDKAACLAQADPSSLENSSHGFPQTDSTNLDTSLGEEELPSE